MVDLADLGQLGAVVGVLDGRVGHGAALRGGGRRVGGGAGAAAFLGAGHALGDQHVVQTHQLRVGRLLVLRVAQRQYRLLLDLAQHLSGEREENTKSAASVSSRFKAAECGVPRRGPASCGGS